MSERKTVGKARPKPTVALIEAALNLAVQDAVEEHRRLGQPLAVWKNGKVVYISPDSVKTDGKPSKRRRKKAS